MRKLSTRRLRIWFTAAVALVVLCWSPGASAAERLLVFATEVVADEAGETTGYWWADSAPAWTATDEALGESLSEQGVTLAQPAELSTLSRIYRQPAPSDSNALAMATVFGEKRVLVGEFRYERVSLSPVGLAGWSASADLRLIEAGPRGGELRRHIELRRATWAPTSDEALPELRAEVARAVARLVAGELRRQVGPVGVDMDEPTIGIAGAGSRRALEAVRTKLGTFAGVEAVREAWAAEGVVALEINPGVADREESVRQHATRLATEGIDGFVIEPEKSRWPDVVLFGVAEEAER